MFRMKSQNLCSRQILSTYIHVGNAAGAWARIVPNNPVAFPPSMEVMGTTAWIQEVELRRGAATEGRVWNRDREQRTGGQSRGAAMFRLNSVLRAPHIVSQSHPQLVKLQ